MSGYPALIDYLRKGREQADCWEPGDAGGFFAASGEGRTPVLAPSWLIDDGNLVLAVLVAPTGPGAVDGAALARSIDKSGRLLDGAILDAGLHRLLVLVVVVEGGVELDEHLESRGQFRVLFHDGGLDQAADHLARRLEPLEAIRPFLVEIADVDDLPVIEGVLSLVEVDESLNDLRNALIDDIRMLLTDVDVEPAWPAATAALEALCSLRSAVSEVVDG